MELTRQECRLARDLIEKEIDRLEKRFRARPETAYTNYLRKKCDEAEALLTKIKESERRQENGLGN